MSVEQALALGFIVGVGAAVIPRTIVYAFDSVVYWAQARQHAERVERANAAYWGGTERKDPPCL